MLKRWFLSVLRGAILGALLYFIALIAGFDQWDHTGLTQAASGDFGWLWFAILIGGAFAIGAYFLHPALRPKDWRRAILAGVRAPGALVVGFVAIGVIGLLQGEYRDWEWIDCASVILVSATGWCMGRSLCLLKETQFIKYRRGQNSQVSGKVGIDRFRGDSEDLKQWFLSDDPIHSENDDLFGHCSLADSIAKKILSKGMSPNGINGKPAQRLSSGIVLGRRGMGKTSICNLVQKSLDKHAENNRRIILLNLSAWEYAKSPALRRAVVRQLIKGVGSVGSAWGLAAVPAKYISVIGLGGGFWSRLSDVLSKAEEPEELVRRIGKQAVVMGVEIVVWIDDTERVAEGEVELDSLLYLIRETPGIGFVLAYSPEGMGGRLPDSHKLADFSQGVRIESGQILKIMGLARNGWIEEHRNCGLFGEAVNKNSILEILSLGHVMFESNFFITRVRHLATVIGTPRNLKACLRRIHRGWVVGRLAGEIELDSLILFSALVECGRGFRVGDAYYPWIDIFADARVMEDVRGSVVQPKSSYLTDLGKKLYVALAGFQEDADHDDPVSAAELALFKKLFVPFGQGASLQSFMSPRGLVYIQRAVDEGVFSSKPDQAGLQLLDRVRKSSVHCESGDSDAISDLAAGLFDGFESDSEFVLAGIKELDDTELIKAIFLAAVEAAISRSESRVWCETNEQWEPLKSIREVLQHHHIAELRRGVWGVDAAMQAMRAGRLSLGHELLYWWGPDHSSPADGSWVQIASRYRDAFQLAFDGGEDRLADELKRGKRWVLHWLIRMQWAKNLGDYDPLIWKPIAPVLLRAAAHEPQVVAIAASFLYADDDVARGGFNPDSVKLFYEFFGDLLGDIMELIASIDVDQVLDLYHDSMSAKANQAERDRLEIAINGAKQWLTQHPKPETQTQSH